MEKIISKGDMMDKKIEFNMMPKWLTLTMFVCKWLMVMIPFVVSSIALFWESNMSIMDSGLWNCIWMLSLVKIIDMTNE
tara:strand:- start:230 stop:466 length:237 start_codon:yes stop_codon:yes gene_type:complete